MYFNSITTGTNSGAGMVYLSGAAQVFVGFVMLHLCSVL